MNGLKKTIVVPAYNEAKVIGNVLDELLKQFSAGNIIVVDDGSTDETAKLAEQRGVIVLKHFLNRGLGASLKTGFERALEDNADIIVTFDADGQHQVEDISRLIQPILDQKAEIVIGSRFLTAQSMPVLRNFYNRLGNFITFIFFGIWTTDSQSGLRAFSRSALQKMETVCDRMEISSEIIHQIKKQNLRLVEIPIEAIYTNYSLSKGQNFINGFKTFLRLLIHKLS
jgi:glycosyltransferase involved in cell wall biosynthesis